MKGFNKKQKKEMKNDYNKLIALLEKNSSLLKEFERKLKIDTFTFLVLYLIWTKSRSYYSLIWSESLRRILIKKRIITKEEFYENYRNEFSYFYNQLKKDSLNAKKISLQDKRLELIRKLKLEV